MTGNNPVAGWYDDAYGKLRYWDGQAWTHHTYDQVYDYKEEVQVEQGSAYLMEPGEGGGWAPNGAGTDSAEAASNAWAERQQMAARDTSYPRSAPAFEEAINAGGETKFERQPTDRSFLKFVLLGLITLGLYSIYVTDQAGKSLNTIAADADGKRTMNYWLLALVIAPLTLGIGQLVWNNNFSNRIGLNMQAYGLKPKVKASTFWLWGVLGALIIVGPFVYAYKWINALNELCESYNTYGAV